LVTITVLNERKQLLQKVTLKGNWLWRCHNNSCLQLLGTA